MSVLNTLLCGGRAAQPPEGKYGECFSYSLRYSLIISLRFFFSFAHFIVCFMSEIAQALPSSYAPGTSCYIFFSSSSSCCHFSDRSTGWKAFRRHQEIFCGIHSVRRHCSSPWDFLTLCKGTKNILCLHSMLCDSLFLTGRCTSQQTCSTYSVCCDGNATHRWTAK